MGSYGANDMCVCVYVVGEISNSLALDYVIYNHVVIYLI